MEKCGRARQATDDIIWHMHIAWWITKATDTHSEYVILTALLCKNGCTCALQYYIVRASSVLLL